MLSPKSELFLKELLSYVKFVYDRNDIRKEFEAHLSDKIEYYTELGYEQEEAELLSIKDMGDAKEIGTELNKQHNPVLGWLWRITNSIAILLFMLFCFIVVFSIRTFFESNTLKESIVYSDILYQSDIDMRVRIDDRVIRFTNVIMEENGDLNICYRYYNIGFWGVGGNFGYIGDFTDNKGNKYMSLSGTSHGGILTKGVYTISDFSKDADTLIISYDRYNRNYHLEIPLEAGESYE
jgi:hypothetical protein